MLDCACFSGIRTNWNEFIIIIFYIILNSRSRLQRPYLLSLVGLVCAGRFFTLIKCTERDRGRTARTRTQYEFPGFSAPWTATVAINPTSQALFRNRLPLFSVNKVETLSLTP